MARKTTEKLPTTDAGWQSWLQNHRPPEAREWLPLGHGLTVCRAPSGDVSFQARLRRVGDKNARRITLGHFPACSVAEARQRLLAARAVAKEGRDPTLDRRRAREGITEVGTFGQLADLYLADRAERGKLRPKTIEMEVRAVATLKRALGDRLLSDIETQDIAAVVRREEARLRKAGRTGRSANIALGVVKQMYRYAKEEGYFKAPSPAAELKRPTAERPRARILFDGEILKPPPGEAADPNEVGLLAAALTNADAPGPDRSTRAAIYLGLLLGMRAGEVASLQWSAVRLDDAPATLTVIRGKTKAATRTLPLPPQAVAILRALRAETPNGRYVFPARSDGGRADHLHAESLSRAFSRLCDRLHIKNVVLHDTRRTCLSALIELTGDQGLAERVAGHAGGSTLSRHYDKSQRLDAALKALTQWSNAISAAAVRAKESV